MAATVLDGKAIGQAIRDEVREAVRSHREALGSVPGLTVILVGDDPASQTYVRNKQLAADEASARYREGRALSPVDGMPIGIKDLIETKDLPQLPSKPDIPEWSTVLDPNLIEANSLRLDPGRSRR